MLRETTTHPGLDHGKLEFDRADSGHRLRMIRYGLARRMSGEERGFTLIELLVTMILLGILAAIALAVFLNQQNKGKDATTKSSVTNIAREMQACRAGLNDANDFRQCDDPDKLAEHGFKIDPGVTELSTDDDCSAPLSTSVAANNELKIVESGRDCFAILGVAGSGNRFSYVHHNDGTTSRDCSTRGVNGCPSNGDWAG